MEPAGSTFFWSFAVFLLAAPLYKAGNRPVPLLLLELAAIAFLFVTLALRRERIELPRALLWAIGLLFFYPLVQLIPLPEAVWRLLPGHGLYAELLERFGAPDGVGIWRPISILPSLTEYGWLALLPPLACLLIGARLPMERARTLLLAMVVLAGGEALLGLFQVAPGGGGALYFGNEEPGQYAAIGTFVNRSHLAAMLAMVLPVIVGLLVYSLRPGLRRVQRPHRKPGSEAIAQRVLLIAVAVMILLCLFFTRSRAGIASSLIGLACSGIVLVRARAASIGDTRTRFASWVVLSVVAISVLLALAIGMGPVLEGFSSVNLRGSADFRTSIYAATWNAALQFLPFGSGLSTFAGVFPRYQVNDAGGYIDHAHNDYLQALMEMGIVAPVIVGLLLFAYLARMRDLLFAEGGRSFTLLQVGAGLGMLPVIIHSLFEFPLHMPAIAMWFATLAGIMFRPMVGPKESFPGERHKSRPSGASLGTPSRIELPPLPDRPTSAR